MVILKMYSKEVRLQKLYSTRWKCSFLFPVSALSAFNRDWKVEKLQVGSYNHAWELDTKPEHHISLDGSPWISWDVSKFLNTIFSLSTTLCMNNLLENFCEGKHQVVFLSQARQQSKAWIWICWEKCEEMGCCEICLYLKL